MMTSYQKIEHVLHDRLLKRELGANSPHSKIRGIYGDRTWVNGLDIVNELGGHSGCVNALNWSKGGGLLASGSDDQHLNIHSYQPEDSAKPFKFTTTVATGHMANIFSVKFMPHSNDRTVVTAAGDSDVRIFDIEHSGRSARSGSGYDPGSSDRAQGTLHSGVQFLSQGDTNARVYRSHSDRVKRVVTESSPHLFLTCSEDGEVRQWDLRQPSSAYPRPRGGRGFLRGSDELTGDAPPALISYKHHRLDLNTISCSPSQPHYIALGGRHLHCFLHDRRMIGRDRASESGSPGVTRSSRDHSNSADTQMDEATRCVKRFAPNGKRTMRKTDDGHITACKISDANPNELIVSWSGDHIYDFDMMRVSDARNLPETSQSSEQARSKAKESSDRKRKRTKTGSGVSQERETRSSRRLEPPSSSERPGENIALRVRYGNGQSENIPIESLAEEVEDNEEVATPSEHGSSFRIASTTVKIRQNLFTLHEASQATEQDPTGHASSFTAALDIAASSLKEMGETIRTWRYPVDPDELEVQLQKTLKRNRESAWRLVQASGTISRLLGGRVSTDTDVGNSLASFSGITPAPNEGEILDLGERFSYDFLKAIILWLSSGPTALVEGFTRRGNNQRFPIPQGASIDAIDEVLIPYLLQLAGDRTVPNVDASRFEIDTNRMLFESERKAVNAFAQAVKIPFEDLSSRALMPVTSQSGSSRPGVAAQDRRTALRYWGFRVARGVLMNAGEGVNHAFVDRAFGGLGQPSRRVRAEERALQRQTESIDPEEEDPIVHSLGVVQTGSHGNSEATTPPRRSAQAAEGEDEDQEMIPIDDIREAAVEAAEEEEDDEDNESEDDEEDGGDDDASVATSEESEEEDNDDDDHDESAHLLFRSAFSRASRRSRVQHRTPCLPHIRTYRGHCNVKTVKDVNFYGLNDEYVVSGSDSGHLFIWDRASQELLNILEGDGEVVNVVQAHPYEPMLAVSGIDHTVKIFSPDARLRRDARKGVNLCNDGDSGSSSLRYGGRRLFGGRPARDIDVGPHESEAAAGDQDESTSGDEKQNEGATAAAAEGNRTRRSVIPNGLASRRRMHQEYQITSQNDVERRGGNRGEGLVTRGMLAQFLASVAGGGMGFDDDGNGDEDEEGGEGEGAGEGGGGRRGGRSRLGIVGGRLVLRWFE